IVASGGKKCPGPNISENNHCHRVGIGGGIVAHNWYYWQEQYPIIGISGNRRKNSGPSLLSVEEISPYCWYQWEE
ncbi:unnamed protein product, partial [Staurois parvus]